MRTQLKLNCLLPALGLLVACVPAINAAPLSYAQASAPWGAAQAAQFAPQITDEFLVRVESEHGREAAAALAEKARKVPELLERLGGCRQKRGDAAAAEKFFTPELRAAAALSAAEACSAERGRSAAPAAAERITYFSALEAASASGAFDTRAGSARFFDGSVKSAPAAALSVPAGAPARYGELARPIPVPRLQPREIVSKPPPPVGWAAPPPEKQAGPFNRAAAYLSDLRRENWADFKGGELSGARRGKALGKAAAGAVLGFALWYTNLAAVETAAVRLRRDRAAGAPPRVLWADTGKLAFHIGLSMIAPIPIANISAAVAAGRLWGYVVVGYVGVAIANRYYHFAD